MPPSTLPDYYAILHLDNGPRSTPAQIKTAYRKESLLSHPDKFAGQGPAKVKEATDRFQAVADAYCLFHYLIH